MSVDIEPSELSFRRPFTFEVSQTLTIKNPNTTPVAFKVKTTAPKQYCVRPNAGRIEPGQDFDVTVLLQAMKSDPPAGTKCRDKFLVQSVPITGDKEFTSISSVFETTEKASIQERKIRVVWLTANDSAGSDSPPAAATPNRSTAANARTGDTPEAQGTFSSPSSNKRPSSATPSTAPPPYSSSKKEDEVPEPQPVEEKKPAAESSKAESTGSTTSSSVAATTSTKSDEGLRQRSVTSGTTSSSTGRRETTDVTHGNPAVQGVPVGVTALLCFIAFMLAYIFF